VHSFLAGWLPLAVAAAFVACLYSVRGHITRFGSWQRLVTWPLPLLTFVPVWVGLAALVLSLIGGDLRHVHRFAGSRGPVAWEERGVTMLHTSVAPHLERQWFEIKDGGSGKMLAKVDYVHWLAVQTDSIELLGVGHDVVWLDGEKIGLHTRDLYTGTWLKGHKELLGDVALADRPYHYDSTTHRLDVKTSDGRTLVLE
jgi:hypothetical protein